MSLLDRYARVDDTFPCPICSRHTWCMVSHDGTTVICPRVPSDTELGTAGYLHHLTELVRPVKRAAKPKLTTAQCEALQLDFTFLVGASHDPYHFGLGVDGSATVYPMRDASTGRICGFRKRYPDGSKRSHPGSREGFFYPDPLPVNETVFVCEGPTDAIAAHRFGLTAIGRPNCAPRCEQVEAILDRMEAETVVIVADADTAGRRGANNLGAYLIPRFPMVHCIVPVQHKDLAEYAQQGFVRQPIIDLVEKRLEGSLWRFL